MGRVEEQGASQAADALGLVQMIGEAMVDAASVTEALHAVAGVLTDHAGFTAIGAILADHAAGEQVTIAAHTVGSPPEIGFRRPIGEGLIGATIAERRQYLGGHADTDPRYSWEGEVFPSLLLTPVVVDGRSEAVLELCDRQPDQFTVEDAALMQIVADQVTTHLRGLRMREETERRADRLALAGEVAKLLSRVASAEEVLDEVAGLVHHHLQCGRVTAGLVDRERGEFVLVADELVDDFERFMGARRPLTEGITGRVIRTGVQFVSSSACLDPDYAFPPPAAYRGVIVTPVVNDGRCVATLAVWDDRSDAFDTWDAVMLEAVAEQLAVTMQAIELRGLAEARAGRLGLTLSVARSVADSTTIDQALAAAAERVAQETGVDSVLAVSVTSGEQELIASVGALRGAPAGQRRPADAGVTGVVLRSGRPLQVNTEPPPPETDYWEGESRDAVSALVTPVILDGRPVATLELYDHQPGRLGPQDAVLMLTVAEQLAAELRAISLRGESERRAERLSLALGVATVVADAATVEEALRACVRTIADTIDCGSVGAFLVLPETDEQLCVIDIDRYGSSVEGLRRPLGMGAIGQAIERRAPLFARRTTDIPEAVPAGEDWQHESAIIMPVLVDGAPIAVLALLDSRVGRFDDEDLVLMQTVAEQLASALRGTALRAESEARAAWLALTLDVAKAVAGADSVNDALIAAADTIFEKTGHAAVTAIRIQHETGEEVAIADRIRAGSSIEGRTRPLEPRGTGLAATTGRQVRLDVGESDIWDPEAEYAAALATPVMVEGRCEATLVLYAHAAHDLGEADGVVMQTIAEQLASALRGIALRDQSEARAIAWSGSRDVTARCWSGWCGRRNRSAPGWPADLHDDTVQVLSACVIALDRVRRAIEDGAGAQAAETLEEVRRLLAGAVDRTRRMTFELRPALLWHNGLEAAVRHLLDGLSEESGFTSSLRRRGARSPPRPDARDDRLPLHLRADRQRPHPRRAGSAGRGPAVADDAFTAEVATTGTGSISTRPWRVRERPTTWAWSR